jgi:hypothetical protein
MQSSHARKKLAKSQTLRDIIVGAELQAYDPVSFVAAMLAGEYHRHVGPRADLAQQVEPVLRFQKQVENHDGGLVDRELPRHVLPSRNWNRAQFVLLEIPDNYAPRRIVTIDNEDVVHPRATLRSY